MCCLSPLHRQAAFAKGRASKKASCIQAETKPILLEKGAGSLWSSSLLLLRQKKHQNVSMYWPQHGRSDGVTRPSIQTKPTPLEEGEVVHGAERGVGGHLRGSPATQWGPVPRLGRLFQQSQTFWCLQTFSKKNTKINTIVSSTWVWF